MAWDSLSEQEATAVLLSNGGHSVNAVVWSVLSEPNNISSLKQEQRITLKAFPFS